MQATILRTSRTMMQSFGDYHRHEMITVWVRKTISNFWKRVRADRANRKACADSIVDLSRTVNVEYTELIDDVKVTRTEKKGEQ
jgi:hypothetical protein